MNSSLKVAVEDFMEAEHLPASYLQTVERHFVPLVEQVMSRLAHRSEPMVLGISGCQGSGKSTLAALLVVLFRESLGLRSINLSIDDFYLSHAQRQRLAQEVHPLLATRGVPGTHDVSLAVSTIEALKQPGQVAIPRFDKAQDDRKAEADWPRVMGPMDIIILEGWCLGVGPQSPAALAAPINVLEEDEDADGRWRHYVNQQLQEHYPALHGLLDFLVMLRAPAFEQVYQWRQQQEDKLAARYQGHSASDASGDKGHRIMTPAQLKRFIQHYERITRHALETLPDQADVVFSLTEQQTIAD